MPLNKETKLKLITSKMGKIVPRRSSKKDGFGIKLPMKVDMSLNKEIKRSFILTTIS